MAPRNGRRECGSGLSKASGAFPEREELMVDRGAAHWPEGPLCKQPESLQGRGEKAALLFRMACGLSWAATDSWESYCP